MWGSECEYLFIFWLSFIMFWFSCFLWQWRLLQFAGVIKISYLHLSQNKNELRYHLDFFFLIISQIVWFTPKLHQKFKNGNDQINKYLPGKEGGWVKSYAVSFEMRTPVDSEPPKCLWGEMQTKSTSLKPSSLRFNLLWEQKAAASRMKKIYLLQKN